MAKKRTSSQHREREFKKRERQQKKRDKAALKRENRQNRKNGIGLPPSGDVEDHESSDEPTSAQEEAN